MLSSVEFDNQPLFDAGEINDEAIDAKLAAKLGSMKSAGAKQVP